MTARRAGADAHFEMTTTTMGKKEKETVESNWTTIVDDLDHDDDDDDDDGFVVCKKPDSETRLIGRLNETIGTRSFLFLKILFLLFDSLTHFLILICSFSKWMLPKPHYRTDQPCTRIFIHTLTLSTNTTTTTNEHHLTNPTDDCGRNNESVPSSRPQSRHRRKQKETDCPSSCALCHVAWRPSGSQTARAQATLRFLRFATNSCFLLLLIHTCIHAYMHS